MLRILLFIFTLITGPIYSQVGINNNRPSQMLDVNGKIRIGDDQRTATEGAIRLNKEGDFEGYSNDQWSSFTKRGRSILPSGAVPIYGYLFNQFTGLTAGEVLFGRFTNLTTFTTVPAGKYVIVTSIMLSPTGAGLPSAPIEANIGRTSPDGSIDNTTSLRLRGGPESIFYQDPLGILMIVRPGEKLKLSIASSTNYGVTANIRGFLVDNLNYD